VVERPDLLLGGTFRIGRRHEKDVLSLLEGERNAKGQLGLGRALLLLASDLLAVEADGHPGNAFAPRHLADQHEPLGCDARLIFWLLEGNLEGRREGPVNGDNLEGQKRIKEMP
jgi:hypothetical protein